MTAGALLWPASVAMINPVSGSIGPPWFDDKPVAVIGCGPSLAGIDLSSLRGCCHVIAVKAAMFQYPWADCGVGLDFPRFIEWRDRLGELSFPVYWAFDPHQWKRHKVVVPANVVAIRRDTKYRLSEALDLLNGPTSGFAGLNVAMLKRAKQIYLFGYDYAGETASHAHPTYYANERKNAASWAGWAAAYRFAASVLQKRDISVINASPDSSIGVFAKMPVEAVLRALEV